jgi:toxin YoeB
MKNVFIEGSVIEDFKKLFQDNPKLVKKVFDLISEIQANPFPGTGKPEPLKYQLKGLWSRRINSEHRLVYEIAADGTIKILSVHGHYDE